MRKIKKWRELIRKAGALLLAAAVLAGEGTPAAAAQTGSLSANELTVMETEVSDAMDRKVGTEATTNETVARETASAADLKNPVHHCDTVNQYASDYTDWSYVYFGSYPQTEVTDSGIIAKIDANLSDSGDTWVNGTKYRKISEADTNYSGYFHDNTSSAYRYFKWERIRWRVLHTDGSKALIVAADGLDCQEYNEEYTSVTWESCSMRKWLNGYSGFADLDRNGGTSFTAANFYATAFDTAEQGAILQTSLANADNPAYGTAGGNATGDKIFLLSLGDINNTSYGFCGDYNCYSSSRWAKATDYSHAMGAYTQTDSTYTGGNPNCRWWLRSPGSSSGGASGVLIYGSVSRYGFFVTSVLTPLCQLCP